MTWRAALPALLLLALTPAEAGAGAAAAPLASWEGVYKSRFKSALVTGESYQAENILEIVDTGPDRLYGTGRAKAYVRIHLDFYNAHICDIWGIAELKGETLVYRKQERLGEAPPCVLTLRRTGSEITLADQGTCQPWHCGARGMFDGIAFDRSTRRAIRYLPRLKASKEYRQALDERR